MQLHCIDKPFVSLYVKWEQYILVLIDHSHLIVKKLKSTIKYFLCWIFYKGPDPANPRELLTGTTYVSKVICVYVDLKLQMFLVKTNSGRWLIFGGQLIFLGRLIHDSLFCCLVSDLLYMTFTSDSETNDDTSQRNKGPKPKNVFYVIFKTVYHFRSGTLHNMLSTLSCMQTSHMLFSTRFPSCCCCIFVECL